MLERVGEFVRIDAALLGLENQTLRYGSVIDAIAAAKKARAFDRARGSKTLERKLFQRRMPFIEKEASQALLEHSSPSLTGSPVGVERRRAPHLGQPCPHSKPAAALQITVVHRTNTLARRPLLRSHAAVPQSWPSQPIDLL